MDKTNKLFRVDFVNQLKIAAKKPLLKDTNNKKRLAWAKMSNRH